MDQQHTPLCSWTFAFKDMKDKPITMKITAPFTFLFDLIFILITDLSDSSSTSLLISAHQHALFVSLKTILNSVNHRVHIYGLKTIYTNTGEYEHVVCYSEKDFTLVTGENITINIHLKNYEEEILPLSNPTQALPVTIHRNPPSSYRLDVNHVFSNPQDFVVIVKVKSQLICCFLTSQRLQMTFPFELPSASVICCKVITAHRHEYKSGSYCLIETTSHSKPIIFNTFLSLMDNIRLFNIGVQFDIRKGTSGLKPIKYFYRNKSIEYFNVIINHLNGEMRPYLKSNGGDQGSVLNGRLSGLFFSTYLDDQTNKASPQSFYGPIRLHIQAQVMFNPFCNLYFADFYCHYKRHHVTIVLTPTVSSCNKFCQQYLLPLNIYKNPYLCLRFNTNGSVVVFANMNVTVEVFYTETINVLTALSTNFGYVEATAIIGRGFARPTGIPKNPTCEICNLK